MSSIESDNLIGLKMKAEKCHFGRHSTVHERAIYRGEVRRLTVSDVSRLDGDGLDKQIQTGCENMICLVQPVTY